jgi:hypothetical protein
MEIGGKNAAARKTDKNTMKTIITSEIKFS